MTSVITRFTAIRILTFSLDPWLQSSPSATASRTPNTRAPTLVLHAFACVVVSMLPCTHALAVVATVGPYEILSRDAKPYDSV